LIFTVRRQRNNVRDLKFTARVRDVAPAIFLDRLTFDKRK